MTYLAPLHPLSDNDRILQSHVRPQGWVNPTPQNPYNLVVIGAGTAGLVAAAGAAGLGARVALVERGSMGGDCLNVGCVPSKSLISSARQAAAVQHAGRYGVHARELHVDFPEVMQRMRRLRASISPHDSAKRFSEMGVDVYFGQGSFTGRQTLDVAGTELAFRRAVIATGTRPAELPVPGLKEAGYLTNETLFSLNELPRRLIVIGGGPLGCEMAQAFARFGSSVTQIEKAGRVLPREESDAALLVQSAMQRDGVTFVLGATVTRVETVGGEKVVVAEQAGEQRRLVGDQILVSIGRTPNLDGLGLQAAGVEADEINGVKVTDRLQTTNPKIYAAGDVCSDYKFTHSADFQARIVVKNALFYGRSKASKLIIPWCTYTSPELAHIGMGPIQAKAQGVRVTAYEQPLSAIDRAVLDGEDVGFVRIYCREGSDQIVGATIVAGHAGELIGEIALAMTNKIGLRKIASAIHPYPTQAEAIRKLGDQYNRTRLRPVIKTLLAKWFAWTR